MDGMEDYILTQPNLACSFSALQTHQQFSETDQHGLLEPTILPFLSILALDMAQTGLLVASSPGPSQILSHSRARGEIKSGSGLGTRLAF